MASAGDIAKRYFAALAARDFGAAAGCWAPGGIERVVGLDELTAPDGIQAYFEELLAAFPDFQMEVLEVTTARGRAAVRWRARATFAGPGRFRGFAPNGARVEFEGCDVLTVTDDLIQHNDAYLDSGDVARQLGFLPPAGSRAEARLARLANVRTRMASRVHGGETERIADGVWLVRGGFPARVMNVYLVEDEGGLTVFDAGIAPMSLAVITAAARMGQIKRVVLGHADCDHRGSAGVLDAPIYCHPADRPAAESAADMRDYWDLGKLDASARLVYPRLFRTWDSGALSIEGTVQEGDEIAGFRVVHLPGHAPGLIGLFRESDRLALVSDCFYTLDPQTGRKGAPRIPHPAFNADLEQTRASIRKLAELDPSAAWPGHADAVTGDVAGTLRQVADAPL